MGGIVVDGGTFPWSEHPERFRAFLEPEPAFHGVSYADDFPNAPYVTRCKTIGLRNTGSVLSPFNAFLHLQGLETLAVRLPRHEANSRAVAEYLVQDPRVSWVSFLGLPDNPYHELGRRYLGGHVPSIMTFGVHGGHEAGIAMFNSVKLFKRLLNMGDAKSLITHPASTTHRQLKTHELEAAGISPDMVRLSVGLEHPDDLNEDLDQALAASVASSSTVSAR
jgi:O-acetylhomoserine (thiol)-lyase